MKKMKVSELVLDFDVYPRPDVDGHNVSALREAARAGVKLPPVVICKKSKRVVDGFHRVRMYRSEYGDAYEIEVIERTYKNDGEIVLDAARMNAGHGKKLSSCDRTRCALLAERLHVPIKDMAMALSIPEDTLKELVIDRSAFNGKLHVPIKRTIEHMRGKKLTRPQLKANEKLSGMNQLFYVNQLITLIDSDLLDTSNVDLMKRLEELAERVEALRVAA